MGTELAFWSKANEVSNVLSTIIQTYNLIQTIRKEDMANLAIKIELIKIELSKRETIALGTEQLIRTNIMAIAEIQRYIDEKNLTGLALELAMDQLRQLSVYLNRNLQNCRYLYY